MKNLFFFALGITIVIFSSGCVVSRATEKLWAVGTVEYYADFSEIENRIVYEHNGEYYIKVKQVACQSDPKLIGVMAVTLHHLVVKKNPVESKSTSIWGKISDESKQYLCTSATPDRDISSSDKVALTVEPVVEMTQQPAGAVTHPIIRELPPPEVIHFCCGDVMLNSQLISTEKSLCSYALLPLMPIAVAWDISATIVMSTYFDFILVPNILIVKAGTLYLDR